MKGETDMRLVFCVALALTLTPAIGSARDLDAGFAAYGTGDFVTALREWRPLAQQGNAEAQANLGLMYQRGEGVPQDYAEAVSWYRKAAEQGFAQAQANLGGMYLLGEGVPQDFVSAHMWFNLASGHGDPTGSLLRDALAPKMTPEDISQAQRRAQVCLASEYRACD